MEIDIRNKIPDIRYLNDMGSVLYDKVWLKSAANLELYYMYRKVRQENGLNNNITVVPAKMLGKEFVKTKGHTHIGDYQEIYIVLAGEAIYLMQKIGNDGNIEDVYYVKAKKGDSVIIPGCYGHITINPSRTDDLKTEDWTSINCKSDYSLFEKMQGACYYYTQDGWLKNENYKNVPALRQDQPLSSVPENLDFLKND